MPLSMPSEPAQHRAEFYQAILSSFKYSTHPPIPTELTSPLTQLVGNGGIISKTYKATPPQMRFGSLAILLAHLQSLYAIIANSNHARKHFLIYYCLQALGAYLIINSGHHIYRKTITEIPSTNTFKTKLNEFIQQAIDFMEKNSADLLAEKEAKPFKKFFDHLRTQLRAPIMGDPQHDAPLYFRGTTTARILENAVHDFLGKVQKVANGDPAYLTTIGKIVERFEDLFALEIGSLTTSDYFLYYNFIDAINIRKDHITQLNQLLTAISESAQNFLNDSADLETLNALIKKAPLLQNFLLSTHDANTTEKVTALIDCCNKWQLFLDNRNARLTVIQERSNNCQQLYHSLIAHQHKAKASPLFFSRPPVENPIATKYLLKRLKRIIYSPCTDHDFKQERDKIECALRKLTSSHHPDDSHQATSKPFDKADRYTLVNNLNHCISGYQSASSDPERKAICNEAKQLINALSKDDQQTTQIQERVIPELSGLLNRAERTYENHHGRKRLATCLQDMILECKGFLLYTDSWSAASHERALQDTSDTAVASGPTC